MYGVVVGKLENLNDDIGRVGTEFIRYCPARFTSEFVEVGETGRDIELLGQGSLKSRLESATER